jgi:polyphosphate kinase
MNDVYVLNYLVNKRVSTARREVVTAFIDLKAGFDNVNRNIPWGTMKKSGVRKGLVYRVKELKTRVKVRSC